MKLFASYFLLTLLSLPVLAGRETKTINSGWKFRKADTWETVSLPHTWNTDAYTHKDYYKGVGWYEKQLQLPQEWANKQLFLKFEAASKSAEVYINNKLVGTHKGGYTAFTFDITSYCSFTTPNTITVKVDNSTLDTPPISGDFTFFGGIYRDVWLIATSKQHFDLQNLGSGGIYIETPEVTAEQASLQIKSLIKNDAADKKRLLVEHTISSPDGEVLQSLKRTVTVNPSETFSLLEKANPILNPKLWTPETPYLYKVESVIKDARTKEIIDIQNNHTGFRWYKFDAEEGFFLNGKPYKLNGICRHQDQKPIGVALTDEMHRRDMLLMKEMGANFIRISHYPQDNAILEQCDKLGMLVWEEIPIIDIVPDTDGYAETCETNLREMIRQHYNHPSVITWGYMNEILLVTLRRYKGEELKPVLNRTLELANRLEKVLKEEDAYRVSTMAFHGSNQYNEVGLGNITDVVGWNLYQGWYGGQLEGFDRFLDEQHQKYPTHPIIVSEYGAGSDKRIHSFEPKSFDFSIEYQQKYLEHYLPAMEKRNFVAGSTHWNFIDFSSALRDESMPRINNKGLVYADRTPKDVYYYYKAMFRKDTPVLHIASRDWSRRSGIQTGNNAVVQPVKIYTNLPEVELWLNGKSLGTKKSSNCTVVYDVPFEKGTNTLRTTDTSNNQEDVMTIQFNPVPDILTTENMRRLELAINVGSNCFYTSDESNLTWLPDRMYNKGSWGYVDGNEESRQTGTQTEIHNTLDGPLFQTLRTNPGSYQFDVPAGEYELELLFADIFKPQENLVYQLGQPATEASAGNMFTVYANNCKIEYAFSPGDEVGYFQAIRKRFVVSVTDCNGLNIRFENIHGKSFLNGLKLRKL
ncbi:family 1 glycosylhydrolase [Bacteroides sp. 519]|uniref:family 1 glycosylhydrolase n=1 Tax=Bacteroides sp. 519 TaxID=2302937 RepID=UPI001EF330E6|nr:family 1 glycosylhydrolase [Bacteroides sp. 519]